MSDLYENKDQIELMRAIVKAVDEGKEIQASASDGNWFTKHAGTFNFQENKYRVKPEPLVMYVNIWRCGANAHYSEEDAKKFAGSNCTRVAVKMVEVQDA